MVYIEAQARAQKILIVLSPRIQNTEFANFALAACKCNVIIHRASTIATCKRGGRCFKGYGRFYTPGARDCVEQHAIGCGRRALLRRLCVRQEPQLAYSRRREVWTRSCYAGKGHHLSIPAVAACCWCWHTPSSA